MAYCLCHYKDKLIIWLYQTSQKLFYLKYKRSPERPIDNASTLDAICRCVLCARNRLYKYDSGRICNAFAELILERFSIQLQPIKKVARAT